MRFSSATGLPAGGEQGVHLADRLREHLERSPALQLLHVLAGLEDKAQFHSGAAAVLGEAAIDLPDKLITVVAALLIAQGLPARRAAAASADLDLGEAVTFVVRSNRWVRKLLISAACLLFFWLIVPFLLFVGYTVKVARSARSGSHELPAWDHRWLMIKDGFNFLAILLIWNIPAALLSIPAALVSEQSSVGEVAGIAAAGGSVWGLAVLLLEPAIISQYMERRFLGALNPVAIIRRARVNLALTIVVGALVVALSTISLIGVAALLIGVLVTFPYASFVSAFLIGRYARLTEPLASRAEAVDR